MRLVEFGTAQPHTLTLNRACRIQTSDIKLPSLAWTVPDLDASATVILINRENGNEALCLSATLSNGKTVYLTQVQWALAGLTIGAFIVALVHSFWPLSPFKAGPEWRFATIVTYFQHVAMCGFLSLDFPGVYKHFTLNFAWAQGLIYMSPIDKAINRMRYATGGINREGQSYAVVSDTSAYTFINGARNLVAESPYTVPTVQQAPTYNLISGIETTAEDLGITYANSFMTVFIVFLLFLAVMVAVFLLASAIFAGLNLVRRRRRDTTGSKGASGNLRYFIWTNILRTFLIAYLPLVLFVFWQFQHKGDSGWLAILTAVLVFVLLHVIIAGLYWHVKRVAARAAPLEHDSTESIRTTSSGRFNLNTSLRWTTVSQQFKRSGNIYVYLLAASAFASAAFVAFAQGHGLVQLIGLIVIECIVFIALIVLRPFTKRSSNVLIIFVSLFKIAAYAVLVTFYVHINLDGIIVAVLGFVILAIQSVMTVILFIVTLYNLGAGLLWARRERKVAEQNMGARKAALMQQSDSRGGYNGHYGANPYGIAAAGDHNGAYGQDGGIIDGRGVGNNGALSDSESDDGLQQMQAQPGRMNVMSSTSNLRYFPVPGSPSASTEHTIANNNGGSGSRTSVLTDGTGTVVNGGFDDERHSALRHLSNGSGSDLSASGRHHRFSKGSTWNGATRKEGIEENAQQEAYGAPGTMAQQEPYPTYQHHQQ